MEITLKQVETLRDRAGVSEAEAREALERNGGDLLEALLDLERLGKSHTSGQGGFYSTQPKAGAGADALVLSAPAQGSGADRRNAGNHLGTLWRALLDLFQRTLSNQFEVWRGDRMTTSMPVLTVTRARKLQKFLSQPFAVAENFTGLKGVYVPLAETVKGFAAIVDGQCDDLPEWAFFNVGTLADARKKYADKQAEEKGGAN